METIGHHSCSNKSGFDHVLRNAPFLSVFDNKTGRRPFLGSGFYFFDNNRGEAEEWGRTHYNNQYCILEANMTINDKIFFDLVGATLHQQKLELLRSKFADYGFPRDNWQIGKFIEFLKRLNTSDQYKGIFSYEAIRAVDVTPKPKFLVKFASKNKSNSVHYTNLAPKYIICLISLDNISLANKNIYCV